MTSPAGNEVPVEGLEVQLPVPQAGPHPLAANQSPVVAGEPAPIQGPSMLSSLEEAGTDASGLLASGEDKDFKPIKVLDIELALPLEDLSGLDRYQAVQGLVRHRGVPLGYVHLPVRNGGCPGVRLADEVRQLLARAAPTYLASGALSDLRALAPGEAGRPSTDDKRLPTVTVAVCTRERTEDLNRCLKAVVESAYPGLEILVIDNAPRTGATRQLVRQHFPSVRYIEEPRPGLDWARNRAIEEATGEVVAFTDDDTVVDPGWVRSLAWVFAQDDQVMAVTGLVVPYELETRAQHLFERYGGFGRGFVRRWYQVGPKDRWHLGSGAFGTGANMAFRRSIFATIGTFDPALDVGTATNGGGDLEMFFRVLEEGHVLVYEPAAMVRHRHRRSYEDLKTQLRNHGIGFYSYVVRSALAHRDRRADFARLGLWWLVRWNIGRFVLSFPFPRRFPRDLIAAELTGSLAGLIRYPKARRESRRIAETHRSMG